MENIKNILNTVLTNRSKATIDNIESSTDLRAIGFDSLDMAELTVRIEAEYDIDIFEDGIVTTVGQIMEKLA